MEQSALSLRRRDEPEFNLREWALKARISRENTNSRRFSASSYIKSFREDSMSFRSNITISSTASSPGYSLREEIDPSTYSFTTALKALQARSVNSWECLSPDGFALNSKWNEAEKYISNPLSGEVPMECLSSKTLNGRSFRNLPSRITMSAPLIIYPSHSRLIQTKPYLTSHEDEPHIPIKGTEKKVGNMTRDVGTQSTPPEITSSSPSPASTPPIQERPINCDVEEGGDSANSSPKFKYTEEVEVKETREKEEPKSKEEDRNNPKHMWRCRQVGCFSLSLRSLWMRKRRQREKHKPRKNNIFLFYINGC